MKRSTLCLFFFLACSYSFAQTFPMDTIVMTGHPNDRINLVFLSDGYTEDELDEYILDVKEMLNDIFSQTPFKEYKPYFNVFAIKVPSEESGASHPSDADDCPSTAVHPVSVVNNYFGSSFDFGGIHRLLVPESIKPAMVLADNFPLYDQAFVLVNSSFYGGSGGVYATSSIDPSASEVAIHEIGHSFAGLADEYWAGASYAAEKPNLTKEKDPTRVRWKNWVGKNAIGVYAYAEAPTWFRPHQNCKMRFLNVPFCSVCRETFVERIHDLTDPVVSYSPNESTVELQEGSLDFSIQILAPVPNTLQVTWKKNNVIMSAQKNKTSITLPVTSLYSATSILRAEIIDTTALTRSTSHLTAHLSAISWTIETDNATVTGIEITSSKDEYDLAVYPNAVTNDLNLSYSLSRNSSVAINFLDNSGRRIKKLVSGRQVAGRHEYSFQATDLNMNKPGLYFITFDINGVQYTEKIIRN